MLKKRIVQNLEKLRREHGLTQTELASQLGVTQSHLSRVIAGAVPPGNKLEYRIGRLLAERPGEDADEWLQSVKEAAGRSRAFRTLVNSALAIMRRR